nr:hypothetical protein [Tanacetum cinerariifolium]
MARSSTKELLTPFKDPKREFRLSRKLFKTLSLEESRSPKYNLFSDLDENFKEELRNVPAGSIDTWETLKKKFLNKYCPPTQTAKEMEEINNFQQELDETLYQHYFMDIHEVILFHKGLDVPTRQILDSKGAIPSIRLSMLRKPSKIWEIKKVNERVYVAQVGCESCNGPHYTKDCPLKEEVKTFKDAYYTQFGVPFSQGGRYRVAALGFYQRDNGNPSFQERGQTMEESLSKFMVESVKRHDENSNFIKEIRASTNAAIRNQRASIKALEIQIKKMSKVLQERGFGSLHVSTKTNPRDHVKLILTNVKTKTPLKFRIDPSRYAVLNP